MLKTFLVDEQHKKRKEDSKAAQQRTKFSF